MDNMNGKDFLKTLKSIDINTGLLTSESVDWIFYKPETKDMLFWLCSYLNENNIENSHELYEHELLRKKGNFLSGDRYDNKVQEIDNIYPGIFEISTSQINKLQLDVQKQEDVGKSLEKLITNYLTLDYKIQQRLSKLESEQIYTQAKRETTLNNCLSKSKDIDVTHAEIEANMKKYSDVLLNYHNIAKEKYFISQMPLDVYKQEDDNFRTYLNLWIEKEFDVDEAIRSIKSIRTTNKNKSESFVIGQEFERMHNKIQDSICNRVRAECASIEIESRIEYMEKNYDVRSYEAELRIKAIQLNSSINSLTEDFNRICVTELQQAIETCTQNLINSILSNEARVKLDKCRKMMTKLRRLNLEVKKAFSQNCLLALLFKAEKRKLESTIKMLSSSYNYLTNQQQEITGKYDAMNMLESDYFNYKQTPIEERERIISDFLAVVTGDYKNQFITSKDALTLVLQQETRIECLQDELFTARHQTHINTVKQIENKIKEIKEFIWYGPTSQPVLVPYSFIENVFELQSSIDKCAKKFDKCMQTYKETENTFSNPWFKVKKLLYVWFLTEPKKVLAAIQRIEDHVYGKNKPEDALLVDI